jgi:hypothetical protein
MAEVSAISWTDATLSGEGISPKLCLMSQSMTSYTESDAILHVKSQLWENCKRSNVVGIKIASLIVSAMKARKFVAEIYFIPPSLQFGRQSLPSALNAFPINIAGRLLASRRPLTRHGADFGARFKRMLLADPIAWSRESRHAHFSAALV